MKIFISWSGERSKAVALALHQWLKDVIQTLEPWMSAVDIEAGARWSVDVADRLQQTRFGIICLTGENLTAPWLLFEAGALAKTLSDTYVCPYLIGIEPTDIPGGPLTQFQGKRANKKETWELLRSINNALKDEKLAEDQLSRYFERWWGDLEPIRKGHAST
jgi:TIR domain